MKHRSGLDRPRRHQRRQAIGPTTHRRLYWHVATGHRSSHFAGLVADDALVRRQIQGALLAPDLCNAEAGVEIRSLVSSWSQLDERE